MNSEKYSVTGLATIAEQGVVGGSITITYSNLSYERAVELKEIILREVGLFERSERIIKQGDANSHGVVLPKNDKRFNGWQMKFIQNLPDGMTRFDVCSAFRRRFAKAVVADTYIFNGYEWFRKNCSLGDVPVDPPKEPVIPKKQEPSKPEISTVNFEARDTVRYGKGLVGSIYPSCMVIECPAGRHNTKMLVKFGVADDRWVLKSDYELVEKKKRNE